MPMIQKITTTGYGYIEPTLDKARKNVSLVDGAVKKIEPITTAVIKKADGIADAGYKVVEDRVVAINGTISSVKDSAYKKASPVVDKVVDVKNKATGKALQVYNENPVILRTHQKGMSLCDSIEALIDRLLPEPETEAKKTSGKPEEKKLVLYRAIAIPFRIPARTIHIVAVKVDGAIAEIIVKAKWAVQLTKDQKEKLSACIAKNSRQLMDKVSNSSAVATLKNGKATATKKLEVARKSIAEGQRAIVVKCHIICERSGLIELKEITVEKMDQLHALAAQAAKSGCNGAYKLSQKVVGSERATIIFTKIGEKVPLVKSAVCPEGSTGSLEAAAAPAPGRQAGTGDTGAALQMPELMEKPQLKYPEAKETGVSAVKQDLSGLADLAAKFPGMQAPAESE
eukprot:gnl/TRDRNA2_/TRDRNA2_177994_c0_seq10.p1 gnl/TRDRNA2_/TRDRNA2_177994_c0~~gnl/TRDRNA2_/TRDRNA2_177994_c0_seq10.p1  ORF type:complete len:399 (+),score=116.88 gnl/TRDRNA2_/TRDRNA2_177994_c0_seq10:102-1298(+)